PHGPRNVRVSRQAISLRTIGVRENVDHVCPTNAGRIVDTRLLISIGTQLLGPPLSLSEQVFTTPEAKAVCRTRLDAGWLQTDCCPVRAESALVNFGRLRAQARHIKWTSGDAVATADAVVVVEIYCTIWQYDNGTRRWTSPQASRIGAVHALVLSHVPGHAPVVFSFVELNQVPEVVREVRQGLVGAAGAQSKFLIVPLLAGDLASLAANAG